MGVACTLSSIHTFPNLMVKSAAVFLISFSIYEVFFLIGKLSKRFAVKRT
jgi:hypothetical protein